MTLSAPQPALFPPLAQLRRAAFALALFLAVFAMGAQNATPRLQLEFAGLHSAAARGQINSVRTDGAGNVYLLLDQQDGVRLLKTDGSGSSVLAEAHLGAGGDSGLAMALDAAGQVYVTGTTTSGKLSATSGAAFGSRTDASTNSFVGKFDGSLQPIFVTFTGGSRIATSAIAATADAVFITGITYSASLPVTPDGIQQSPALGSFQNGFVEKFSSSGSTLLYATYLTGTQGDTTPTSIVADGADNAYVAGSTTASGFPTVAALVPEMLSNPSGFLTKLSPGGDAIVFSTFVPGDGITSLTLDASGQSLLLTGSVALGQFPVATVTTPIVPATYQVLLRLPLDGSAVRGSTLLAPGTQSFVSAAADGSAWVDGSLAIPFLPVPPLGTLGSAFAAHVTTQGAVDQTARLGGLPNSNPSFASLPLSLSSVAVDGSGSVFVGGSVQPTASSSLLPTETYDLPLRHTPTGALPSSLADAKQTAATCNGSLCAGSAGYLAKLNVGAAAPALAFSADDLPRVVLRNLGALAAEGLSLSATGTTLTSNCPASLAAGGECDVLLAGGSSPGTLAATTLNGAKESLSFGSFPPGTSGIVFFPKELDFGIVTAASLLSERTITISNLGGTSQSFASTFDSAARTAAPFTEVRSDCATSGSLRLKMLPAGASCHITLGFKAGSSPASDGFVQGEWNIGGADVLLAGYSQSSAESVSATEIDFGTQFVNGLHLPRFLYLSNNSQSAIAHAAVSFPSGSSFTLADECPSTLSPATVCRIRIDYKASGTAPSSDSTNLTLDGGVSVLITGKTLPQPGVTGTTANPNLSISPASLQFSNTTVVTGVSSTTQTATITNTGAAAFSLRLDLSGDFTDETSCGAMLGAGQSCAVVFHFVPAQSGVRTGLLAVTAGAGTSPAYLALSGTATDVLAGSNGSLDLGSAAVGEPVTQFYKVAQPFASLFVKAAGPYLVALVEDAGFGPQQPAPGAFAAAVNAACHICYLAVQFTPAAAGTQTGSLTISSEAGGANYVLALRGTGTSITGLVLSPSSQDFGPIAVHSASAPALFTLTNLDPSGRPVTVAPPALTGDFALSDAVTGGNPCSGQLLYGASCLFEVVFAPGALGTRPGIVSLGSSTSTVMAQLVGVGTSDPGLAANPAALRFDNVPGGSSTQQTIMLTNTSGAVLLVEGAATTSTNFKATSNCGSLGPGATCSIAVTFQPGAAVVSDLLSVAYALMGSGGTDAQQGSLSIPLTGSYTASNQGLQIVPARSDYGSSSVGVVGLTRSLTLNNLTAKDVVLSFNLPRQYARLGPACATLPANGRCTFAVAFTPLLHGGAPGTIVVESAPADGSAGSTGIAYAEGYGVGAQALEISASADGSGGAAGLLVDNVFRFGEVPSGQAAAEVFNVTNQMAAGSAPVTVRRVTSEPPFLSTTTCGLALTPGQSCTVTVTYAPVNEVAGGTASPASTADAGALVIESDTTSSPTVIHLAGLAGPSFVQTPSNATPLASFTLSQSSLSFGTTAVGDISSAQTVAFLNTGTTTIHITGVRATADFAVATNCATVVAGSSCAITVSAVPQTTGVHIGAISISSDAAVSLEFVSAIVAGGAPALTFSPNALDFGPVVVGATAQVPLRISNGSASPVTFNGLSATGDFRADSGTCPAAGGMLPANSGCSVAVSFQPSATGVRTGTLSLASSASSRPVTAALTGLGTQSHLTASTSTLTFGSVLLGSAISTSVTLRNSGTASVMNLQLTSSGDYAVTIPCPSSTLPAGGSCTAQLTFTPTAAGARPGTLTVTSSDPSSPFTVALLGTGVQPGSFTLTVDGGAASTRSVKSGAPASYQLLLTPLGTFSGPVALTCTPVLAAQYASCSLFPSTLILTGGTSQAAAVTLNTITSADGSAHLHTAPGGPPSTTITTFLCSLLPGMLCYWRVRRRLRDRVPLLLSLLLFSVALLLAGCGGGGDSTIRYTPPGTYQYQVTATSVSGVPVSQTVTLNLVVTPR